MPEYKPEGHRLVENPKVSVCITTYNHEKYIAQALDSVLMQETDFPFEIILGEDNSSDGTRAICKAYKERFPNRIRLFLNERENVIYIKGKATGRWNFLNNLSQVRGEFTAILEGDDYWSNSEKLQYQVERMTSDEVFSGSCHAVSVTDGFQHKFEERHEEGQLDFREALDMGIATCSLVFRSSVLDPFPEWGLTTAGGDWPVISEIYRKGRMHYTPAVMGHYRIHKGGIWSSAKLDERFHSTMDLYEALRKHGTREQRDSVASIDYDSLIGTLRYAGHSGLSIERLRGMANRLFWYQVKSHRFVHSKDRKLFVRYCLPRLFSAISSINKNVLGSG